jgi:hypothetical protein
MMRYRITSLPATVLAVIFAIPLFAQQPDGIPVEVQTLLQKMEQGQRETVVRGVIQLEESHSDSLRRYEFREVLRRPDDLIWDRLQMPTSPPPPREMLFERGHQRGGRRGSQEPLVFGGKMMHRLQQNYNMTVNPGEPVLGRTTTMLRLESRNPRAPLIRFWVDDSTGILLKRVFSKTNGWKRMETFTRLQINPTPEEIQKDFVSGGRRHRRHFENQESKQFSDLNTFIRQAPFQPWIVADIPDGYEFELARIHRGEFGVSVQMTYTDGATAFSIFQSEGDSPKRIRRVALDRPMQDGETVELSRGEDLILVRRQTERTITVLGSAPRDVLYQVINQLQ